MIEIRFHGRGGQGAVTSVELLALAAIEEGKFAQGFQFRPERRGALRWPLRWMTSPAALQDPILMCVVDASCCVFRIPGRFAEGGIMSSTPQDPGECQNTAIPISRPCGCEQDRPRGLRVPTSTPP
jgi:hypothetical protein